MTRWIGRGILIVVVSGFVAATLPAVRQFIAAGRCLDSGGAYDYARRTCQSGAQAIAGDLQWFQAPDGGSLVVGLAIAVALARLFTTLDRRKRSSAAV